MMISLSYFQKKIKLSLDPLGQPEFLVKPCFPIPTLKTTLIFTKSLEKVSQFLKYFTTHSL